MSKIGWGEKRKRNWVWGEKKTTGIIEEKKKKEKSSSDKYPGL